MNIATPGAGWGVPAVGSRAAQHLRLLVAGLGKAGVDAGVIRVDVDIGEKRPGDLLVESYRIEEIRRGSVGVVYLCQDVSDGEHVAFKTYSDEIRWGHPDFVRRFWHEANSWVTLPRHPNIVEAWQVRDIDGRLHLVLECAEGGDLRSRLRLAIPSTVEAVRIGLQVCFGLRAIHETGLVHRDVKPENILFGADGTAKVSDLGLAMALAGERETAAAGTRGYWAPEQIAHPDRVTAAADVHALGVVLHELLTGARPKAGTPPPSRLDTALNETVAACRDPDPARRPSLADLIAALGTTYRDLTGDLFAPPLEPKDQPWSLPRVLSLSALGRTEEALRLCQGRLTSHRGDKAAYYGRALCLYDLGRYQQCIQTCLESLRASGPGQDGITRNLSILMEMCSLRLGVPGKDAGHWTMLGQLVSLGEGDVRAALRFADLALEIDARDPSSWHLKAQCLYNLGRHQDSLACYERAAELAKDEPLREVVASELKRSRAILAGEGLADFRLQRDLTAAQRCLQEDDAEVAKPLLQRILKTNPEHPLTHKLLSSAAIDLGHPEEAIQHCDQVLAADAHNAGAWILRGKALRLLRRYREALESLDRAVAESPDRLAWHDRGMCLLVMGCFREAGESFEAALRLDPGDDDSRERMELCDSYLTGKQEPDTSYPLGHWYEQAIRHIKSGRLEAGLDCLRTALGLEPNDISALYLTGFALWRMGLHRAAADHCRRVIEFAPSNAEAWNILGNALEDLGEKEQALAAFERVVQLDDTHADGWNGRGLCLRALGRPEEALESFRRACELSPSLSRAWFNRADTLDRLGRHEEAVRYYDRAVAADAGNHSAHHNRGLVLARMGRRAEAIASLRRAIETDPGDATVWNSLGAVQTMIGDYAEAAKSFQRSLELDPSLAEPQRNLENLRIIPR